MKVKYGLILIPLVILFIPGFLGSQGLPVQDHGAAEQHCDNATEFVEIPTVANTETDLLKFEKTEVKVSKNTCVQVKFTNLQLGEHDFSIDHDDDNDFEEVHIHMANNTAGHMGANFKTFNISTPNVDITYDYYCSVLGHRDGGMEGKLIVGEGSKASAPGFEILVVFGSLITIGLVSKLRKQK